MGEGGGRGGGGGVNLLLDHPLEVRQEGSDGFRDVQVRVIRIHQRDRGRRAGTHFHRGSPFNQQTKLMKRSGDCTDGVD